MDGLTLELKTRPLALIVLDGWGINPRREGNAIALANKPVWDRLLSDFPHTTLEAHGEAVGLVAGLMGNSNVGHLNLGAGQVVVQDLLRINRAVAGAGLLENGPLKSAMTSAREGGGSLHLMGLLSDGGVHSHLNHLFALLEMARQIGVQPVYVHAFLDGRDVPPVSASTYIDALEARMAELRTGVLATISGRYYAMDRDNRWERTEKAFRALVHGQGLRADSASAALAGAYERDETDEFVLPTVIGPDGDSGASGAYAGVKAGDAVIFFNFRADRARQLTRALTEDGFDRFPSGVRPSPLFFVGMTQYSEDLAVPCAFPPRNLQNTFGEHISTLGLSQLRVAETEKYAHVTYFFSGGREDPFPGEDRRLVPSPRVATYDLRPEMSAAEVTETVLVRLGSGNYDVVILNYANPDMVGHTGILPAAVQAIEVVDGCLGKVLAVIEEQGGAALVVSDHGNAEQMIDYETGEPHTAHTAFPVPCVLVDGRRRGATLVPGVLGDVAPTMLDLMGIAAPEEMTGRSLLRET